MNLIYLRGAFRVGRYWYTVSLHPRPSALTGRVLGLEARQRFPQKEFATGSLRVSGYSCLTILLCTAIPAAIKPHLAYTRQADVINPHPYFHDVSIN